MIRVDMSRLAEWEGKQVVYVLKNGVNGKLYVGQTLNMRKRMNQHKNSCGCPVLKRAIDKHGWQSFEVYVHAVVESQEEADNQERKAIGELSSHVSGGGGYNLDFGGKGGGAKAESTKQLMRIASTGRKHTAESLEKMRSKKVSQETRRNISLSRTGIKQKKRSPEHSAKLSAALKGKSKPETALKNMSLSRKGKHLSDEHRLKISIAATGKKRGPYKAGTGEKISAAKRGKKLKPFSEEHRRRLSEALKGKRKSPEHIKNNVASHKHTKRLKMNMLCGVKPHNIPTDLLLPSDDED